VTLPSRVDVICPHCSQQQAATVWSSVNVSINPRLKSEVLSGDLFRMKCRNCDSLTMIEYPCLYHDAVLQFAIWMIGRGEIDAKMQTALQSFRGGVPSWYTLRLARRWRELAETVMLVDAGLNDMAVQFLKLQVIEETGDSGPWFVASHGLGGDPKALTLIGPGNRGVRVELLEGYHRLVQLLTDAHSNAVWTFANPDGAADLVCSIAELRQER